MLNMELDYEKDALTLLKLLAYKFRAFEYEYPILKTGNNTGDPWIELHLNQEELKEVGLTLFKAQQLFTGVCRKQGLNPQDFMSEVVEVDDEGEPYLIHHIRETDSGIKIPVFIDIEDIIKDLENNINKTKSPELIEKQFDHKNKLSLNTLNGELVFNKTKSRLNVKSKPYKILRTLLKSKDNSSTYQELVAVISPNKKYSKMDNKPLADALYSLKEILSISPETENSNPNIFKNIPQIGYRLELSE